ncbi:P27 family phage terminase small subunit [Sphingomonas paucimobilis]|jgi:phage terminase small subunit|uniref:P27 family phage terminase small subunit n=1 Tax=Sphingomonas paucimobilis TaxID=13689 RepID=UPI002040B7C0|nr:P27 family phage terminase small subunit [Sphingomonas paucimobilis]MCM3680251.1 P27 family phage terminase small subunit [Sphingomonas paucimobilis]
MARGGPRPGAGRKRSDPALKATATERKELALATPPAPASAMIAPLHLSDLGQLMFGEIANLLAEGHRANPHWAQHVSLLAQRLEQIQRWQAVLEVEGDTYETRTATGGRMIRARPEVAMLSDAMRQAQSLIGELMLNPSAALRIAEGHKPKAGEFDDF